MVKVKRNRTNKTEINPNIQAFGENKDKKLVKDELPEKSGKTEGNSQDAQKSVNYCDIYEIENVQITKNVGSRLSLHRDKAGSELEKKNISNSSKNNKEKSSEEVKMCKQVRWKEDPNNFKVKKCKVKIKRLSSKDISNIQSKIDSHKKVQTKAGNIAGSSIYSTPKRHRSKKVNVTKENSKDIPQSKIDNNDKDVYEFFSSQSSLSEGEGATDGVIQKLIKEGIASMAKPKPQNINNLAKKKKITKPKIIMNKVKKNLLKECKLKPEIVKKLNKPNENRKIVQVDLGENEFNHFQDSYQDDDNHINQKENDTVTPNRTPVNKIARQAIMNNAQNITKSRMHSGRKMITDKNKLLEIAKQFVSQSTPLPTKTKSIINNNISPIRAPPSPWRVQNETIVPRLFYFSRDNDDLPSYSSDFFPASQDNSDLNSSNAENVPPSDAGGLNDKSKAKVLSPRKTLGSRSPLKTINVVDVLNLPNWRTTLSNKKEQSPNKLNQNSNQNIDNININACNNESENKENQSGTSNITGDCFGFEEYINDQEDYKERNETTKPIKSNLKLKLKRLKRLLPAKPTRLRFSKIRPVFDDEPKQKDIREMLCSTMIDKRSETNVSEKMFESTNLDNSLDLTIINEEQSNKNDSVKLFDDPVDDIQSSFNKTGDLRTYTRYPRRRKKLRHNFTMFLSDSDSESEEEKLVSPRKKRTKAADRKTHKELNKFVEQFNSMCEEVDQYNLVVESSKPTEFVA